MRLVVHCTGGGTHSMLIDGRTTVADAKQLVREREDLPPEQQLLLFAGRQLRPDSSLLLEHHGLDSYSMAQDVVVYMQRQLAQPVRVHLCRPGPAPCRQHVELVEAGSSLANVARLLAQRGLAPMPFPDAPSPGGGGSGGGGGSFVVVKRQDGSSCPTVRVHGGFSVRQLQEAIERAEGTAPSQLCCCQGPDGCLHVAWGPSSEPPRAAGSAGGEGAAAAHVHGRSALPQPLMLAKPEVEGSTVPFSALVHEQAVKP